MSFSSYLPSFLRSRRPAPLPHATNVAGQPSGLSLQNAAGWSNMWGGTANQQFGAPVSIQTAMQIGVVFRCSQLTAGIIASVDVAEYRDDPVLGRVPVPGVATDLLKGSVYPGRQLNSYAWRETSVHNQLLEGNSYTAIRYNGAGRLYGLEYLHPQLVSDIKILGGRTKYHVNWRDGRGLEIIDCADMIHVAGPSIDGTGVGMSRIRHNARNAVAMARSVEEVLGKAHENRVAPGVVMTLPQGLSGDQKNAYLEYVENEQSGRGNFGKMLVADAGTEIQTMSINLADLELLNLMRATETQIAMFFGIPPFLLGLPQTSSFGTGIDSIMQAWLLLGLNSELERIEAELTAKLCARGHYMWFDRSQILNMDAEAAARVAQIETSFGGCTPNEYRRTKHRKTVEGGDIATTNAANISLTDAILPGRAVTPPSPTGSKP